MVCEGRPSERDTWCRPQCGRAPRSCRRRPPGHPDCRSARRSALQDGPPQPSVLEPSRSVRWRRRRLPPHRGSRRTPRATGALAQVRRRCAADRRLSSPTSRDQHLRCARRWTRTDCCLREARAVVVQACGHCPPGTGPRPGAYPSSAGTTSTSSTLSPRKDAEPEWPADRI